MGFARRDAVVAMLLIMGVTVPELPLPAAMARIVDDTVAGSNVLFTDAPQLLSQALDHTTPMHMVAVGEPPLPVDAVGGEGADGGGGFNPASDHQPGSVDGGSAGRSTESFAATVPMVSSSSPASAPNGHAGSSTQASPLSTTATPPPIPSAVTTTTGAPVASSSSTLASTTTTATATIAAGAPNVGPAPATATATSNGRSAVSAPPQIECYHAQPELCAERKGDCECSVDPVVPAALYCCNVTDINKAIGCVTNAPETASWKYLHIRNVTVREMALNVSNRYIKTLLSLAITDGTIQRISTSFARFSSPVCLNVSNNNISEIEPRAFRELRNLTMLDLSYNNLSTIPSTNGKFRLDIRGNVGMLCKSLLESLKSGVKFKDPESTFCLTNRTFNWFNSTDSLPLHQLETIQRVQDECPENCTCELDRLNFDLNNTERKTITTRVACTGLGLTKFPDRLPAGTVTLNISNNNITSLEALNTPPYQSLLRLHADDNQISSLSDLEGMDFISRFTLFSIRRNKLKTVQSYIFTKSLDLGSYIFLEGNPMTCDCNAAKGFKNWLLSRKAQVPDHENIFCEGNTNLQQLVTIQESKLCQSQHDWTDYIYYLIATEILLLVALVCKVSYDYWVFKTAGYLPWPANKMPKLPCDCLCE
ncbi:AGAP000601-PB [Anopheles gambiae str. PEST]|uniref:Protein halfway n=1 Tax=Anopheles gambiae TaxID=7165 RepID=Q7QFP4_ANOGA|nr:protein halfway [Anopheles gambiae]XP_061516211.1 protein halfway [Anopheles gambiae]XP_061516219.1 protein halfway [Anopheles gambiae]XP_061516227.1 protein halfway [Anopheles gambiae]XP_061516232.1 protein halfway [Anopheles gambiae]XP_061516234.1 protein halfway [Anopheles gambiae]XP_061516246.1 protein halfway [Anopheles gambiae]XP_061516251.1 protein halfway [Anopheles gambiae]EAA06520.4 AGAP000601-PA [Anopheles gambiae str. PEST]EGK96403.1 AGAP000601-PB [Anopheles gambiae str. PES